jgi:plastocyanin
LLLLTALLGATACAELDAFLADTGPIDPTKARFQGQVKAPIALLGQTPSTDEGRALQEAPVPQAAIRLADGAGNPIPGLTASSTDATGMYQLPGVPLGHSYVLTADFKSKDGKDVRLKCLAAASSPEITVNLNAHTTLVTESVTRAWPGLVNSFNGDNFKRATEVISANLTNATVPHLGDREAMVSRVAEWSQANPALANSLQLLRDELVKGMPVAIAEAIPSPADSPSPESSEAPASPDAGTPSSESSAPNSQTVTIENNQFIPATVTIRRGGTIVWLNRDNASHTATPSGTVRFASTGAINPGKTTSPIRFEQAGEFSYQCDSHPDMKGLVIVVP